MANPEDPPAPAPADTEAKKVGPLGIGAMGLYLAILALLIFYLLIQLFSGEQILGGDDNKTLQSVSVDWFCWKPHLSAEGWWLLIVIFAGALGSYVHTTTSFADYVGNRKLTRSWVWWLLMRPPIGMALALVFYLLLRGGLMTGNVSQNIENLNPYGFAAISALVGMFARQATDKLREIFDNLFRTEKPTERGDKLIDTKGDVTLTISETDPPSVKLGATQRTVAVVGTGFVPESKVKVDGEERPTKYESKTRLTFELADKDVQSAGKIKVVVVNPPPDGGESSEHLLSVTN